MRRIKSFFLALVLFFITAGIIHVISGSKIVINPRGFALWSEEKKSSSYIGITENLDEYSIPVFGSSEFQHGTKTIYHPASVFAESDFYPMLIGAGYYQSLGHAITLAAIEPFMQQKKAVLILSPQWFRKTGVVDQAYTSRFSELLYSKMLIHPKLSKETKKYIKNRTKKLLASDEKTLNRVQMYEKVLWKEKGTVEAQFQTLFWQRFLTEKDQIQTAVNEVLAGIGKQESGKKEQKDQTGQSILAQQRVLTETDWETLMEQAEEAGQKENQNPLYMDDQIYQVLESVLGQKKDMNQDALKGYQTGPEFDDLECFIQVCEELGVTPMIVILPVNGYYYDHTGFPKSAREAYYEKIRTLLNAHNVSFADFSTQEYTKYFFEDRVHIGKKGWVMVNESIYRFYKEDR